MIVAGPTNCVAMALGLISHDCVASWPGHVFMVMGGAVIPFIVVPVSVSGFGRVVWLR